MYRQFRQAFDQRMPVLQRPTCTPPASPIASPMQSPTTAADSPTVRTQPQQTSQPFHTRSGRAVKKPVRLDL